MKIKIAAILILIFGCSACLDESPISSSSGYYEIEPIAFSLQAEGLNTLSYTSSTARVFYYFYTADSDAVSKPLFVFFNGGPGCATSTGLLSNNTAPYTIDTIANPYSFTQLGNLLYIDAPSTGLSYNTVPNASDQSVREAEFDAQNYNPYIDAAQSIRVILRFLAANPLLKAKDVIIVGESYGGTRSYIMLNQLLFYNEYKDGSRVYKDTALADEIQQHFESVNRSWIGKTVPPEVIANQFGSQILIQPLITGDNQRELAGAAFEESGSVIYQIAAETGTTYEPCSTEECSPYGNALTFVDETAQRDIYKYNSAVGFIDEVSEHNLAALDLSSVLSVFAGIDVSLIPYLGPTSRNDAYRYIESPLEDLESLIQRPGFERLPEPDRARILRKAQFLAQASGSAKSGTEATLEETLGALNPWDTYISSCNDDVQYAYYDNSAIDEGYELNPYAVAYGELFLEDLPYVNTFITDARLDLILYSAVLPDSFTRYPTIVESVEWTTEGDDGYINVNYKDGTSRTIYFPRYTESGHPVPLTQPDKFLNDVQRWME